MENLKVVVLAAGQGTRMKSEVPKVLHRVFDKTMVDYVIEASYEAGASEVCVVVGHQSAMVKAVIKDKYDNVSFAVQKEQLGTGHAVMQAKDLYRVVISLFFVVILLLLRAKLLRLFATFTKVRVMTQL